MTNEPNSTEGASRQRRVVDMMLSMEASLRDRSRIIALTLTLSVLLLSIVGLAFAFAGSDEVVTIFWISAERSTWLGWLSVLVVTITVIDLVVDQRSESGRRSDAVKRLSALKAEQSSTGTDWKSERYHEVMQSISPIPERHFNRLKAKHLEKVEISRLLSKHPGISIRRAKRMLRDGDEQEQHELPTGRCEA